ncbi:hypothetical protein YC2023_001486 [Brassica napus]
MSELTSQDVPRHTLIFEISGCTPKTVRFYPSTSATSILFVARIKKMAPKEKRDAGMYSNKNILQYCCKKK